MSDYDISIDFETSSTIDLRRVGVFRYIEEPATTVTCGTYLLPGDNAPRAWVPTRDGWRMPVDLRRAVATVGARLKCWNAQFEFCIFSLLHDRHGWLMPAPEQFVCTMANAAYAGLPAALDKAGAVLQVDETKAVSARGLMLRMARPRSYDMVTGATTWWHLDDPDRLDELVAYCGRDTLAERAIGRVLKPLPEIERRTWLLDQKMNRKGIDVDTELAGALARLVGQASRRLKDEMAEVTGGAVTSANQVTQLALWLKTHGVELPDLRGKTLQVALASLPEGAAQTAIRVRLDAAKASTAKLRALADARCRDGTVKGITRYYGAGRTGRWSGAGGARVQPQNLPRGTTRRLDQVIAAVLAGVDIDGLELLFDGNAMSIAASCLRACFVAPPGHRLIAADLSQIEARVLAALAGQQDILDVYRSGEDVYTYDARKIGSDNRQLGKALRLGLGFQMGAARFVSAAALHGIAISEDEARPVVDDWRRNNPKITGLWYALDDAFRQLIDARPGTVYAINDGVLKLERTTAAILMRLPSGRLLVYREPRLICPDPENQPDRLEAVFSGVSQFTKQWSVLKVYGGRLAENATQAAARDVMRDAMLAADEAGIDLRLTVHDEIIAVAPAAHARAHLDRLLEIMRRVPPWLTNLPVDAAGYIADRYRKG